MIKIPRKCSLTSYISQKLIIRTDEFLNDKVIILKKTN